ncbi:PQQ-binding-like beta-propeller repeat protein [Streptomyces sp. VRA16 Mangrove soil]|uniref:outer membrane protein assembly factor BamB family protein n=1 Tax=Streptomyces sp. VRA16 Mangrove soil TaxID=2817434 RepID=UPI001A9FF470|nr:PQQ-binding-like beta-propeller repeat protein [Streptomyces sp. VRA16 Mangrove soil]MBO1336047.1 PQQ-binding-like beta-propeller repeat protein [Streptomyces sp. VRA16 Mangrove soil]
MVGAALLAGVLAVTGWALWPGSSDQGKNLVGKGAANLPPDAIRETVEKAPQGGAGYLDTSMLANGVVPGKVVSTPGMWATSKTLVKSRGTSLVGIKVGSDREAWKAVLPGEICATTPYVTVDGRTAIVYKGSKGESCNRLSMFNVDSGKQLWWTTIPWREPPSGVSTTVTMTRGVVVSSWWFGSVAVDMKSGKRLWRHTEEGKCRDTQMAGGKALAVVVNCPGARAVDKRKFQLRELNPRNGEVQWTYAVAAGVNYPYVVSSKPAVLAVAAGSTQVSDLISLDENGKYRATVRLEGDHYKVDCSAERGDGCAGALVSDDQVFVSSGENTGKFSYETNWIVGFSLATGKSGVKFDAGPGQLLHLVRMSGHHVLAIKEGLDGVAPMSLVSLDPATGKERAYFYFNIPSDSGAATRPGSVVVEDGRLYMGNDDIKGSGKKELPDARWMAYEVAPAA